MPEKIKHIIKPLNTLYIISANKAEYVGGCGEPNSIKQKRHISNVALNSILECVSAITNNKLYLQGRKNQTLSASAIYPKGKHFLIKVLTAWYKFHNTSYKRYANTINRHRLQILITVKSDIVNTVVAFLKVEGEPRKILQSFKFFKSEKKYFKKVHLLCAFFGSSKVFR